MNERIKQLLNEATSGHEQEYDTLKWMTVSDKEMKKFAQLIVQECIDLISPYTVSMNRPGEEYLHPILEIRKHFGVEE
jgi:hypothetical protein